MKGDILLYIFKTLLTALLPVEHVHDDRDVAATKVDIHLWTRVLAWTLMHFQYDIFALIIVTSLDTRTCLGINAVLMCLRVTSPDTYIWLDINAFYI